MLNMAHITTDRLAEILEYEKMVIRSSEQVILELLLESLPPAESKTLVYLEKNGPCTSRQIADHFDLVINRVGNILGNLRKWGLVESEAKTGPDGLYYEWRVKND